MIALAVRVSVFSEGSPNERDQIQIYVYDNKGNPILDLTKDELSVFIDGIPREVISFNGPYALQSDLGPSPMNRKLFLIIDLVFSNSANLHAAAGIASNFVERYVLPGDELSVSVFTGKKTLVTHEFRTPDKASIIAVLDALGRESAGNGTTQEAPPRRTAQSKFVIDDRSVTKVSSEPFMAVAARNFFWAISTFEQSILDIPGEKCLILFTGGPSHEVLKMMGKAGNRHYLEFDRLGKRLQASQISTYVYFTGQIGDQPNEIVDNKGLWELAEATGGRFFGSIVEQKNYAEELNSLTGSYYVLGYRDLQGCEGDDHTVKVTVGRPACSVRTYAKTGFDKPFSQYTELEKQVHLVSKAQSELPLSRASRFMMRAFARDSRAPDNLGFLAEINLEQIRGVAGKSAEANFLVFNEADDIIDSQRSMMDFSSLSGKDAYLYGLLSVPPGRYSCRIVVRNLLTGQSAVAATTVSVTKQSSDELIIYPPQVFLKTQGSVYQRIGQLKRGEPSAGTRDLLNEMLVDPNQFVPVFARSFSSGAEIWASVRCLTSTASDGQVILTAFLIDRNDGREIPIPIEIISLSSKGNKRDFFIKMQIPSLEPETYSFLMEASEPRGNRLACIHTTIIIDKE